MQLGLKMDTLITKQKRLVGISLFKFSPNLSFLIFLGMPMRSQPFDIRLHENILENDKSLIRGRI